MYKPFFDQILPFFSAILALWGRTDGWNDGRTDGPMDGRTDEWTDGRMKPLIEAFKTKKA